VPTEPYIHFLYYNNYQEAVYATDILLWEFGIHWEWTVRVLGYSYRITLRTEDSFSEEMISQLLQTIDQPDASSFNNPGKEE
jgi:hypothetical protein